MTNSQRLATVREHLLAWLHTQQADDPAAVIDAAALTESILIVDGFYAGRTFESADHRATWFMEPDELKIHATGGGVVAVFQGDAICEVRPEPVHVDTEAPISIPMSENLPEKESPSTTVDRDDSASEYPKAA